MAYKKFQVANNAKGKLDAGLTTVGTTLIMKSEFSWLFPNHNGTTDNDYLLTLQSRDGDWKVVKREIVLVVAKSGNTFTIQRAYWFCPANDDAISQTNTAFSFDNNDEVYMNIVAEAIDDLREWVDEKAKDTEVVHKEWTELITGQKYFSLFPFWPETLPSDDRHLANKRYVDEKAGQAGFSNLSNTVYRNWLLVEFDADTLHYTLQYNNDGRIHKFNNGVYEWTVDYKWFEIYTTVRELA